MASFLKTFSESQFDEILAGEDNELRKEYPFVVMDSGFPFPPGQDYILEAMSSIGEDRDGKPKGDYYSNPEMRRYINWLYYHSLWNPDFSLSVSSKRGPVEVPFILGHLWGYEADGPRTAKVMVVGKGPGKDEERQKRNFCGESGAILEKALRDSGVTREEYANWYVTNVCRFMNPNAYAGDSAYSKAHVKDCLPTLRQEIALVRPEWVLCLGGEAASAVMGMPVRVGESVGQVFEMVDPISKHPFKVAVSTHPAAAAHASERYDDVVKGVSRFWRFCNGESSIDVREAETDLEHIVCSTPEEWSKIKKRLTSENHSAFAVDAEWEGQFPGEDNSYVRTIQFSWAPKKALCLELFGDHAAPLLISKWSEVLKDLNAILKGKRIIGHGFTADLPWLRHIGLETIYDSFIAQPEDDEETLGWEKTATQGGFDTMIAAHAHNETALFGLEELAMRHLPTIHRWDAQINDIVRTYCSGPLKFKKTKDGLVPVKDRKRGGKVIPDDYPRAPKKLTLKNITGYGFIPRKYLLPYALYDADVTFRLYELYNKSGGFLDCDEFGNCCREPFWRSMRALKVFLEMHERGIAVDMKAAEEMRRAFEKGAEELLESFRTAIKWPTFNPDSNLNCVELLFGEQYTKKPARRPKGAVSLGLTPYKTTGKRTKLWEVVEARGLTSAFNPSADRESLEVLAEMYDSEEVTMLRDFRFLHRVGTSVLRPPTEESVDSEDTEDLEYDSGLLHFVMKDGRVHSKYSQTKETGRASSWQPPLMNLSKKRDIDYRRILGDKYTKPIRAVLKASPGHLFVESDFSGAELLAMAVQASDRDMIDMCLSSLLPESDPRHRDLHSMVAINAFQLRDEEGKPLRPTKGALKKAGHEEKRDIAKPVDFGYAYGMTEDAAYRKIREVLGSRATLEDARLVFRSLEETCPRLPQYFSDARKCVTSPGFLINCYGRLRRFQKVFDAKQIADQERQAMNFPIQSAIADAMSEAMHQFWAYREQYGKGSKSKTKWYWFVLQIHDSLLLEVPIKAVEWVMKEVVPECMSRRVEMVPCHLDGFPREDPNAPYHLGFESKVYESYGLALKDDELKSKYGICL